MMQCAQCSAELVIGGDYVFLMDASEWFCDEVCLSDYLREHAPYTFRELEPDLSEMEDENE